MQAFSNTELERMQTAQESAMMDACVPMRYSETRDELNHPVGSWEDDDEIVCGLDMRGGDERTGDGRVLVSWDAMLRLPIETVLDLRDRIRIIERFGTELETEIIYQIVAPPQQGPSGLLVKLKKLDPGE